MGVLRQHKILVGFIKLSSLGQGVPKPNLEKLEESHFISKGLSYSGLWPDVWHQNFIKLLTFCKRKPRTFWRRLEKRTETTT